LLEALRTFERALEIDPGSVEAKIGAATVLVTNLGNGWSNSFQQDEARADHLLLEALEGDPNDATAHVTMGLLRRLQGRLGESKIDLETAIALDPNHAVALRQLGSTLIYLGQPEAAIPVIDKSMRLNPRDRFIANTYTALGICHLLVGHTDLAIDLFNKARAANPRHHLSHLYLAAGLGLKGDLEAAKAALDEGIKLKPQVNSLAAWRAHRPWETNPQFLALREKTLDVGLRRAGMPEE
jgi:tetratricopeptide (TPR) repeat protein